MSKHISIEAPAPDAMREAKWLLENAPNATDNDNDGALYPDLMAEWYGRRDAFLVSYCSALAGMKDEPREVK